MYSSGSAYRSCAVALLGVKHSGKTSVGRSLSLRTGIPFVDLDDEIVKHSDYSSAREIYTSIGRAGFHALEHRVLRSLSPSENGLILATGGGIADNPDALGLLTPRYFRIYLAEHVDVLYDRIIRGGLPPFLSPERPKLDFLQLFARRDRIYRTASDIVIDCNGLTINEVTATAESQLTQHAAQGDR